MLDQHSYDVLIIGSGAAGLSLALQLGEKATIAVVSKGALSEGATRYAQGGISVALADTDSAELHINDTLSVGAGLCDPDVVKHVAENAQQSINWLVDMGVSFTLDEQKDDAGHARFHLHQEGGHSHRRIIHAADSTGQAIANTLENQIKLCANISVLEQHVAIDLITTTQQQPTGIRCVGAYIFSQQENKVIAVRARAVVLASGGAGKVYLYTSNPDSCTGDGIAMAWRAGCRIANMEFIQFHPTCLYHPQAKNMLISEALRGEGARLLLANGAQFMQRFSKHKELASRDIVARAIDHEMKRLGDQCVYLDISHRSAPFIKEHFPMIYQHCFTLGIDITKEAIPVVPAAHYTCGGVMVDKQGHTDVPGLYAIGEVAYTGLHGANRMASNSLLECIVFAHTVCRDILHSLDTVRLPPPLRPWDESRVTDSDEEVVVNHNWGEIRRFMWDYVGIVRTDKRLQRARHRIQLLQDEIQEYYGNFRVTKDLIELRNIAQVAALIIESAIARKESRGLHYSLNYPNKKAKKAAKNTILQKKKK